MNFRYLVLAFTVLSASSTLAQAADRQADLRAAFDAADSGQLELSQTSRFARDPVYPWLRATVLARQIGQQDAGVMQAELDRLADQAAGRWLRTLWLTETAKRQDWAVFRRAYKGSDNIALRCADLQSRMDMGAGSDAGWIADARSLWLTGSSLPPACDAPFAVLASHGRIDDRLRWQRVDLAIDAGELGLVRALATGMGEESSGLARSYADYLAAPAAVLPQSWPADARRGSVVGAALKRLAKKDPDRVELLLKQLPASALNAGQRAQVRYQVALWTAASYLPGAAGRLQAVPLASYDDKLHEWQAREAMNRSDDAGALAAITRMDDTQRNDSRWQYFEARLRERLGQASASRALYQRAAQSPSFHGWLAADRLLKPYALCALEPSTDRQLLASVASNPTLARALDLIALDRIDAATREWSDAIKPMGDAERRLAVQRAVAKGWYDRAVFGLGMSPDDARHYSLRFPMHHETDIRQQAQVNGLDPAWVAGQTRAESSFMSKARSPADARGLMQLLPGTASIMAKRLGMAWQGGESLYDPGINIRLGTAYMRQMLDRYGGFPYIAIAAYNAGPAPVDRWRTERSRLDPDFFIETIPYKETRDYVARVLAFSVVYDWRLNGNASPLSERMLGRPVSEPTKRKPFICPNPALASQ